MAHKSIIAPISFVAVVAFFVSVFSIELGICPSTSYSTCGQVSNMFAEFLMPTLPFALVFAISSYLNKEAVNSWFKFAIVWVPLSMLAILIAPEYSTDFLFPVEKSNVAFISSALFLLISVLIIGWKYWRLNK